MAKRGKTQNIFFSSKILDTAFNDSTTSPLRAKQNSIQLAFSTGSMSLTRTKEEKGMTVMWNGREITGYMQVLATKKHSLFPESLSDNVKAKISLSATLSSHWSQVQTADVVCGMDWISFFIQECIFLGVLFWETLVKLQELKLFLSLTCHWQFVHERVQSAERPA